jgi:hypothetical protein
MRIRTIKPQFWLCPEMADVSEPAALLAIGLLNYADDEGYFQADPRRIKAAVFPLRETTIPVTQMLRELEEVFFIETTTGTDGKPYGRVATFTEHQKINRPTPSKIRPRWPAHDSSAGTLTANSVSTHEQLSEDSMRTHEQLNEHSVSTHEQLSEDSVSTHPRKGKEGKGKDNTVADPGGPATTVDPVFKELAEGLADVVRTQKHVKVDGRKLNGWAEHMSKLSRIDDVDAKRQREALKW